ncbi:MAG TPA: bifunctional DNA-binding transcriptional regulator/O6-methylguanine-DNA methyltransferase Ada [Pirellulaceae bacterium]|nr:bifunctional DNA-binding transcriptional regulator/O6-methylguanine-DNA methyltransferase Ada [Pirellulaceae bacterium]
MLKTTPRPPKPALSPRAMWRIVERREASAAFYFGVRTTGVFCRPGCSSRLPNRENVLFFPSAGDARAAGFRACKRCRPDLRNPAGELAKLIARACHMLDNEHGTNSLAEVAAASGYSASQFHRLFRRVTGVTPKVYAAARRTDRARIALASGMPVTQAAYAAGYRASSRFYDEAGKSLGMRPAAFRHQALGETIRLATAETSLGCVVVAATARGVCLVQLGADADELLRSARRQFAQASVALGDAEFENWVRQVVSRIETPSEAGDLPLDIQGTAFQRRVWDALRAIPPGTTATYSQIAASIRRPKAVRAVGSACAANPVAVAVPCHRAVRADGGLGGYRWGLSRKRALLDRERESSGHATRRPARGSTA